MNSDQSILIVDDDPNAIQVLSRMLSQQGRLRFALSGAQALELIRDDIPDLILLDAEMPEMNGFETCSQLKQDARMTDVPIIFITSHGDIETEVAGFAMGAADFVRKPPHPAVVAARVQTQLRLKRLTDELRRAAMIDGLTGVANRRCFDELLTRECHRAGRSTDSLSLLMIDVDHFKRYNDRYGHPAGDAVLRGVAQAITAVASRATDLVARYGGEEFVVVLPQTDGAGARRIAQAVVDAVADLAIPHLDGLAPERIVSVSAGSTTAGSSTTDRSTSITSARLTDCADRALYEAKAAGRRQCRHLDLSDLRVSSAPTGASPPPPTA